MKKCDKGVTKTLTEKKKNSPCFHEPLTKSKDIVYFQKVGTWLSLVEHCIRDAGVAGSNPVVPTNDVKGLGHVPP